MKRFFQNNGLSIVILLIFLTLLAAHSVAGWLAYNDDQQEHHQPEVGYTSYLTTGNFIESVFENWESEFLQDAAYVLLTVHLIQRGSSESKDPDKDEAVDNEPSASRDDPNAPWPVRRGGVWLLLYKNSLFLAMFALFLMAFALHAIGGAEAYSQEQLQHGEAAVTTWQYLGTAQFWFESFQNWQSEFLAVLSIVVLSIFLRQQGSPESKPVASPNSETGGS